MAGPSLQDQAYVLHTRRYRENSLLVEALTRDHGHLGLVARAVGGGSRRRREPLQAFRPYMIVWQGRGELMSLTHWESNGMLPALHGACLLSGLYLNELLIRLTGRGEGDARLFDSYATAVGLIARGEALEPVLRAFEVALLEICGYALELETTVDTETAIDADAQYRYLLDQGPVGCSGHPGGIPVRGSTLLALAGRLPLRESVLPDAKRFMRAVLNHHLGDRPLHSRSLFSHEDGGHD
jgi:DNA repair protein RecO (recombination protein O)